MKRLGWVSWLFIALVLLYMFIPILLVLVFSFDSSSKLSFPPEGFSTKWYTAYFADQAWMDSTWRSLRIALVSSAVACFIGTLLAIVLVRLRGTFFAKSLAGLSIAPLIVPNIVIALGVFIASAKFGVYGWETTLILAHAVLSIPFVVMIVHAGLMQVDFTLERAARILGAGPFSAFRVAILPTILPSVVAGAIVSGFTSFDELIVALFIMGDNATLPVRIWSDLRFQLNPVVTAVSSLLVGMALVGMVIAGLIKDRGTHSS